MSEDTGTDELGAAAERVTLYRFPFAGSGAAAFAAWRSELPSLFEVRVPALPGRDARFSERPVNEMGDLVEDLLDRERLCHPCAFFGHSMGALIAYALAAALAERGARQPEVVFVSATSPPFARRLRPPLSHLDDDALVRELKTLGAGYGVVDDELLDLMLPVLRADLELCDGYTLQEPALLESAVAALGGSDDPRVAPADLEAWHRAAAAGRFRSWIFPGGHFYLHDAAEDVLDFIVSTLSEALLESAGHR